jgi:hypothetical protein
VQEYVTWSDTSIQVNVPVNGASGPVVVTVDGISSNIDQVFGRTRTWDGAVTVGDFAIDGDACHTEVACDVNGNAMIVFAADGVPGDLNRRIYASRFDAATGLWSDAVAINANDGYWSCRPRVAMDAFGNAMVVYVWDEWFVAYNTYDAATNTWGSTAEPRFLDQELVDLDSMNCRAEVGMDYAGNAYCVYRHWDTDSIRFARYDAETKTWGGHTQLVPGADYDAFTLAINGSGNGILAFVNDEGYYPLLAMTYNAGTGIWSRSEVISAYGWEGGNPSVSINENGDGVVVFPAWDNESTSKKHVCANRYIGGAWQGSEIVVTEESSVLRPGGPSGAIDLNGNVMATWNLPTGSTNPDRKVYARYYNGTWGTITQISANGVPGCSSMLSQFDVNGNVAVIYKQQDDPEGINPYVYYNGRSYVRIFDGTAWLPGEAVDAGLGDYYDNGDYDYLTHYQYYYCHNRICMDPSGNATAAFVQHERELGTGTYLYDRTMGNRYW